MHLTEHNLRIEELQDFIRLFNEFKASDEVELRNAVSRKAKIISKYVEDAGIGTFTYDRENRPYDVFENIVNGNHASKDMVNDRVYTAIGVYENRNRKFKRKLINPLAWVGEIIRIPFHIMSYAGFNIEAIESSWISKLYKTIAAFVIFIASLLTILNLIGVDTEIIPTKIAIKHNIKANK